MQPQIVPQLLKASLGCIFALLSIAAPSLGQTSISRSLISQQSLPLPQLNSGTQVSLNGRTLPAAWSQWQNQGKVHTAISDTALLQQLGVELLNTNDSAKQPVQWFSSEPLILTNRHNNAYRYLDVTQLAALGSWQISTNRGILQITTPPARVQAMRLGKQPWGDRIVIDLDRPTFWQVSQQPTPPKPKLSLPGLNLSIPLPKLPTPNQTWLVTIDATTEPTLNQQLPTSTDNEPLLKLETEPQRTNLRLSLPRGISPRVTTLPNPNRLVIDLRPDSMVERDIVWAKGLRWRQQFVNLGDSRFPVVWLEIDRSAGGVTLKPIESEPNTLVGIAPILKTAQRYIAAAAINGGFFNRNNKLPLGAIRRDGQWLSSPILNRGAIAWDNAGKAKIARLNFQETITTSTGQRLLVETFNSGYVKSGIARYTRAWGTTYTPLIDDEMIVVIQNNRVTAQMPAGMASKIAFPIPANGYLLTLRGDNVASRSLSVGTVVRQASVTVPADFARFPQILGAGPLLVQNRQIVLDAKAEGFSDAFIRQKAPRSIICTTASGNLLIAAIHNRAGGNGPTLAEAASLTQQLGCVDALNLDGGSSTSLYLGGQLLDRPPHTAARVHNGLGIFLSQ